MREWGEWFQYAIASLNAYLKIFHELSKESCLQTDNYSYFKLSDVAACRKCVTNMTCPGNNSVDYILRSLHRHLSWSPLWIALFPNCSHPLPHSPPPLIISRSKEWQKLNGERMKRECIKPNIHQMKISPLFSNFASDLKDMGDQSIIYRYVMSSTRAFFVTGSVSVQLLC